MSGRREFVEDAVCRLCAMRELCARYAISPQVGYKWLARYRERVLAGLADQSCRPHDSLTRLDGELTALLLAVRQRHPTWGVQSARLPRAAARLAWPIPRTVAALLDAEHRRPPHCSIDSIEVATVG